jgi:oligogalacturonide transporter
MRAANRAVPEDITPQARETVEMLAGMPYENLWGNNNIGYLNHSKPAAPTLKQAAAMNSNATQRLS